MGNAYGYVEYVVCVSTFPPGNPGNPGPRPGAYDGWASLRSGRPARQGGGPAINSPGT